MQVDSELALAASTLEVRIPLRVDRFKECGQWIDQRAGIPVRATYHPGQAMRGSTRDHCLSCAILREKPCAPGVSPWSEATATMSLTSAPDFAAEAFDQTFAPIGLKSRASPVPTPVALRKSRHRCGATTGREASRRQAAMLGGFGTKIVESHDVLDGLPRSR